MGATSLDALLGELLKGISGLYGNGKCHWYQVNSFRENPELEPMDLTLLGYVVSPVEPSLINVCLRISERVVLWSKKSGGIVLEYSLCDLQERTSVLLRLGDTHFEMDHWVVIEPSRKSYICEDSLILESFVERLASVYLERAHWFNTNRRLSVQFDKAFRYAERFIVFEQNLSYVETTSSEFRGSIMSVVESDMLIRILTERLSQWNKNESIQDCKQTRINSFAFRVGHHDIVALVKFDAFNDCWKVILNEDSVQSLRSQRAFHLFTKRQFQAFLHFENGCVCAQSLSKKMGISPRTAERYRAIIIHHLENELNAH